MGENEYNRRLNTVLLYIQDHLSEQLDLEKLSAVACFSKFHFHRIFSAIIGETPGDYIMRLRLERAAALIINSPSLSLIEIGERCGFTSQSIFSRSFSKKYSMPPRQFAKQSRGENTKSKNSQVFSNNGKKSRTGSAYLFNDNSKEKETASTMECEIKTMPSLRMLYLMHHDGYNGKIGLTWHKLIAYAQQRGLFSVNTKMIGMPLDNPDITSPEKCRYKVGITVPESIMAEGEFGVETIPQFTCLVSHFSGREEEISTAYTTIYNKFLVERNLLPDDYPCYEIHLNNPEKDPERKFRYDICVPIKKV